MVDSSSSLLLDELFEAADAAFTHELLRIDNAKVVAKWWQKLANDPRPFARDALLAYVLDGCDRKHHRSFVKPLFKHAEKAGDDALMGAFLCAFDRFETRTLVKKRRYSWELRQSVEVKEWKKSKALLMRSKVAQREYRSPRTGEALKLALHGEGDRFSLATRDYLKRRAWRYFRVLAFRDPARYVQAICAALARYRDEDLDSPEKLLSAWGLLHALYGRSPVLAFSGFVANTKVASGRRLSELQAAPLREDVWKTALEPLLGLITTARSRPVRRFAVEVLQRDHQAAIARLELSRLLALMNHQDEDVQQLVAAALAKAEDAQAWGTLPVSTWLALLETRNVYALPALARLLERYVTPDRLTDEQCAALACSPVATMAELGWKWLAARNAEWSTLRRVIDAEVTSVREKAAEHLLARSTDAERVRDLIDARHENVRRRALAVVRERFFGDVSLWRAMLESPYADVREAIIADLAVHESQLSLDAIQHLWATTLLSVDRGHKAKRAVLAQAARALVDRFDRALEIMRIVRYALRSVRPAERNAALAAVATAVTRDAGLKAAAERELPELVLTEEVA